MRGARISGGLLLLGLTLLSPARAAAEATPVSSSHCEQRSSDGALLELTLLETRWKGWGDQCARLADYLSTSEPTPFSAAERARLLGELPFFERAECSERPASNAGGPSGVACTLMPRRIVHRVRIRGKVPFAVLQDDLRRRIFLRPGTPVDDLGATLERQRGRLVTFLQREGFFGSSVTLTTRRVKGAEPGRGIELRVQVEAGTTARLGTITLDGALPAEVAAREVQRLFTHRTLGLWRERFVPRRAEDDAEKLVTLLQDHGYPEARVKVRWVMDAARHRVDLTLALDPGPRVVVRILGNRRIRTQDLETQLTFREVGAADEIEAETSAEAIRKVYQERGFARAQVVSLLAAPEEGTLWHTFEITEGERAVVGAVAFEGLTVFSDVELLRRAHLKIQRPGLLGRSRLVDEVLAADRRSIVLAYKRAGHAATKVETRIEPMAPGLLRVVHHVDEGPRRWVEAMKIEGLPPAIDEARLTEALKLKKDAPYVHAQLAGDRREIHAFLTRAGYARAEVKRDLKRPTPEVGGAVTLGYRVNPGPRSHFGGVLVSGNFRTREGLLKERLSLEPGDDLDLMVLGRSRRALLELGPFSTVDLTPLGTWRKDGQTWLSVQVKERAATSLDLVLSASTDDGLSLGADLRDRNLLGRAVRLDARVRAGWIFRLIDPRLEVGNADSANVLLSAPEPFGLPFDLSATGFYQFRDKPEFDEQRIGIVGGLSRTLLRKERCTLCPDLTVAARYELSANTVEVQAGAGAVGSGERSNIGRITPSITADWRDSILDPRRGAFFEARLELARPYFSPLPEGEDFVRLLGSAQAYLGLGTPFAIPLEEERVMGGPIILALGGRLGLGWPSGASATLPESEAFSYGGDASVRGLTLRVSQTAWASARTLIEGSAELRWYALQNFGFGTVQLAFFVDAAAVAATERLGFGMATVSVGPALRYVTPVGPISIAWGWPVRVPGALQDKVDPNGELHLTFGYTF